MFELVSSYKPAGDQPQAIAKLTGGILGGVRHQTLLGVTGSGKTFTIANVIKNVDRPTLVISHNKTLAAQLYAEFKGFFPNHAVEYFVSYFDYYQPEAYIPRTDTFIEKDSSRNEEIERLRLSTMSSLFSRRDVVVVASVSCIYGIGSKEDYEAMVIPVRAGQELAREQLLARLVDLQYDRNDIAFERGHFRVRGDTVEVRPAGREDGLRIEFFGDQIERLTRFEPLTGSKTESLEAVTIFPGKQFVTTGDKMKRAILTIREELGERIAWFEKNGKLLEAQRIKQRTEFDLEMMEEMGVCSGIENYSRHIAGRPPGSRPATVMDFFPSDYLLVIDESHATVPQIGAMFEGDRSRKTVLVNYGFRLPSALDNRPLKFEEFQAMQGQTIYASATPAARELEWSRVAAGFLPAVEPGIRPGGAIVGGSRCAAISSDAPGSQAPPHEPGNIEPRQKEECRIQNPALPVNLGTSNIERRTSNIQHPMKAEGGTPGETPGEPAGEDACPTPARFRVPMHAKNRKEAFHEPGKRGRPPHPIPLPQGGEGENEPEAPSGSGVQCANSLGNSLARAGWQPAATRPGVVELVVRPTGLVDPKSTVKPLKGQIDDLIEECRRRADRKERVLVTTLTKRTAEELTDYLRGIGVNVQYLHSEVDAIERVEILRSLRKGEFDVLVGINLLREGLDLPEVSLVAILDADKEGFLRSETSLIQTAGRAARHLHGEVILYADVMTNSIKKFLAVTDYRRKKQMDYNREHHITPRSVSRAVEASLAAYESRREEGAGVLHDAKMDVDLAQTITELESEMLKAAEDLQFEKAALMRDQIKELKRMIDGDQPAPKTDPASYRLKRRLPR